MVSYTTEMETLPQDYYKPVSEMKDNELCMSTLTEDSRPKSFAGGDNKICLLCEFQYYFRPSRSEEHLGVTCTPVKMVQKYKPLPQPLPHVLIQKVCPWVQCFVCPAHTVVK